MSKAGLALQEPLREWKVLLESQGHRSKEECRAMRARPLPLQAPHKHSYPALDTSRQHIHSAQIIQTTSDGPRTWHNNEPETQKL